MNTIKNFEHIDEAIRDYVNFLKRDENRKYTKGNFEYIVFDYGTIVRVECNECNECNTSLNTTSLFEGFVNENVVKFYRKEVSDERIKELTNASTNASTFGEMMMYNNNSWNRVKNFDKRFKTPISKAYSIITSLGLKKAQHIIMPLDIKYKTVLLKYKDYLNELNECDNESNECEIELNECDNVSNECEIIPSSKVDSVISLSCIPNGLNTVKSYYTSKINEKDIAQKSLNAVLSAHNLLGLYYRECDFMFPNVYAHISKDLKVTKLNERSFANK